MVASPHPGSKVGGLKSTPLLYGMAILGPAIVTAAAVPAWRRWCVGRGWVDDPGHRKIHAVPVPLAGGFAVFTGLALALLLGLVAIKLGWLPVDSLAPMEYGMGRRWGALLGIFLGALGMLLLGAWDDARELPALIKFAGQAAIALLVAALGVRVTLFVSHTGFSYAVTVLWILTVTNALNFNDNMNGLCAGLGLIAAAWFGLFAAVLGQYLVAILAFAMAGALLGYLPFNYPRASVFLGDAGSHLVGYLLSVIAILPHFYSVRYGAVKPLAVLAPLLVLAVPLLDLAVVVVVRTWNRRPFWLGDTNHFSHRLVRAGLTKPNSVLVLWGAAVGSGAIAFFYAHPPRW